MNTEAQLAEAHKMLSQTLSKLGIACAIMGLPSDAELQDLEAACHARTARIEAVAKELEGGNFDVSPNTFRELKRLADQLRQR